MGMEFSSAKEVRLKEVQRTEIPRRDWNPLAGAGSAETGASWNGNERFIEGGENLGYGGPEAGSRASRLWRKIEELKQELGCALTGQHAREWWNSFEIENAGRPELPLRVLSELKQRGSTIQEFFLAYVYSNQENIQANLDFLDFTRRSCGCPQDADFQRCAKVFPS